MADEVVTPEALAEAAGDEKVEAISDTDVKDIPADEGGETVTEEEIAKTLKSSGINLKSEAPKEVDSDETVKEEKPAPKPEPKVEAKTAPKVETTVAKDAPDFSFTVKDANDVTFKISPGDSIEDVLAEFDPKNNGQIVSILDQLRKAEDKQAAYEKSVEDDKVKVATAERVQAIEDGWNKEVENLQAEKRLSSGKTGEDRIAEVYKFMAEVNAARMKAGSATINSFEDALDKLEAKETREAKVTQDKADKETARNNGGLVGGSSAPASSGTPLYKAGSARNANQAIKAMGLL